MAYNNFYPYFSQPIPQTQTPQQQNGGFLLIPNEDIVRTYPVAPGNSVTFKIEGKPIVLEKSMGFSQFDSPMIKRYRLVEEVPENHAETPQNAPESSWATIPMVDDVKSEIEALWAEIEGLKHKPVSKAKKKEAEDDTE